MPRRRRTIAAVLAVLALAAGGCTSSGGSGDSAADFQGEQRRVADAVEDLETAGAEGDQDEMCSRILAVELVDRLEEQGGCRRLVDSALEDVDTFGLTVESVRVTGDRAVAQVTTDTGDRKRAATLRLVREGGRWKVAELPA
jgi:hypothetical protein